MDICYEQEIDLACQLATDDIRGGMGLNRLGCRGIPPNPGPTGYHDGIWLADAIWPFKDGMIYWLPPDECRDYLFSEEEDAKGVIPFFASLQETDGDFAGNIAVAKYLEGAHDYSVDHGGYFDLTYRPRKNHRDEALANAMFVFGVYRYWRFFNDTDYVRQYYPAMRDLVEFRKRRLEPETWLSPSVYGLGDVAINRAVADAVALPRESGACVVLFRQFAELAEAIGEEEAASEYSELSKKMSACLNKHLWEDDLGFYKVRVLANPTEDENSGAYGIADDSHFLVEHNMHLLFWGIPDEAKSARLISEVEKVHESMGLYGLSVHPPYPDGYGWPECLAPHRYWNGGIWPMVGSRYSSALFRAGFPDKAIHVLSKTARIVNRDGGFSEYYEADEEAKRLGPFHYAFSAAPYQRAVVEGLFGLEPDYPGGMLYVQPSLRRSGKIDCRLGKYPITMDVKMDDKTNTMGISIKTEYRGKARFRVLVPDGLGSWTVEKGGKQLTASSVVQAEATYVLFEDVFDWDVREYTIVSD